MKSKRKKMTDDWNLSEHNIYEIIWENKKEKTEKTIPMIPVKDVKEFIRRLKEGMPNQDLNEAKYQEKFIDKLAGEKLK